ncbi:MAG TPA: hypothetical protein VGM90_00445 [Kofleriaceae bacterium]
MSKQIFATVVVAAALVGGCKKKDGAADTTGSGSATGSAAATAPTPPPAPPPAPPAPPFDWTKGGDASALPTGAPADDMATAELSHKLVKPGAPFPQDGEWHPDGNTGNYGGNFMYAYKKYGEKGNLDTYYVSMHWLDCRTKDATKYAGKPLSASDSFDFAYCWAKPNGKKIGTYDRYDNDAQGSTDQRAIKVGNYFVIASVGTSASSVAKPSDIEAIMLTLPLADIAKL